MLSCLDCKHCKIDLKHATLTCGKHRWLRKGKGTTISLSPKTDFSKDDVHIRHREIFEAAEMCMKTGDYESMEE